MSFRRLRIRFGVLLVVVGLGALGGDQAGLYGQLAATAGPSTVLVVFLGLGLVVSGLFDTSRGQVRREQAWEKVAEHGEQLGLADRWDQAVPEFHRALSMAGPDPRKLRAGEQIATFLEKGNRPADAVPFWLAALTANAAMFGSAHVDTMKLRERLSDLYLGLGDARSAAELMREQLAMLSLSGKATTLEAATASSKLAAALQAAGDVAGAEAACAQAIAAIEAVDPHSIQLIEPLCVSAGLAAGRQDQAGAESLLKRALECAARIGDHDREAQVLQRMLDVYVASGRYGDAVPISSRLLSGARVARKDTSLTESARLNRQHADLLEHAGRMDEAEKSRKVAELLDGLAARSA